jgi:DNA-binding MarR family transcriptional regulator
LQEIQPDGYWGGGVAMSKGKTPLHLRLTHTDWVECFTELNKAELGVLFYIRTLDPYGDRELDVRSEVVAEVLGLHRSSVSRALKTLANKNLINLEITSAKVTSKARSLKTTALCTDAQSERTDAQSERTDAQSERTDAQSATPKALPDKAPDSPQTIQTLKTLSQKGSARIFLSL